MKICVISSVWGREKITRKCFESLVRRFEESHYVLVDVVVAVSEEWAVDLCLDMGLIPVWTDNKPLGKKMQTAYEVCLEREWDYLMEIDSDTFLTDHFWGAVKRPLFMQRPFFGFSEIYLVDSKTRRAMTFNYLNICCAGRFIRRNVCDEVRIMWDDINKGLGNNQERKLNKKGYYSDNLKEVCVVDLKSDENIWRYNEMKAGHAGFCTPVDLASIDCKELHELCGDLIES